MKESPTNPTFLTLVFKTFSGFAAGVTGTLILLGIFLLGASILQPALTGTLGAEEIHPLFIFVFMAMVFLTSLGSNLVGPLLFSFVQHEKYSRVSSAIYQIFIVNLVMLAIMAPIYLLVFSLGLDLTAYLAGIHVMLSALSSVMILEIVGNVRYSLLGVYSTIFSLLFSTAMIFVFYQFTDRQLVILLFVTLPILWTFFGFISTIVEMFYFWISQLYGLDFLAVSTKFGKDFGRMEPEDRPLPPDVSGGEFLGKR